MEIKVAVLLDCLKHYASCIPIMNGMREDKILISAISLINKNTPLVEGDMLYLGYSSDLPIIVFNGQNISLICIENCKIPEGYIENPNLKMIILDSGAELTAVYNAINTFLRDEQQRAFTTERLFQAIIMDCNLQQITDIGFELLGNPITVLDNSFKTIARAPDIDLDDPIWMESKETGGYVSNKSLSLVTVQSEFKQDFNQASPLIMDKGMLNYKRMVNHIFVNQKAIGTMVVVESERPFRELDLQIISMICKVLSLVMKKNSFALFSKALAYEHFFKDLLDGMSDKNLIQEKIKTQRLSLKEDIYVISIDISAFDKTYKTLQYFKDQLDEMIYDCRSIIYNDFIVIIIMRSSGSLLTEDELERLSVFFKNNNIYGGISECFHEIAEIRKYFSQAVAAASLSRRFKTENSLSYYKDLIVYHLIDLASEKVEIDRMCNPSLLKLVEYDRKNNTSYTQNLSVYLINERNLAHTALALHLHRNTLTYRIEKIKEIMNVDLEDSDIRLHLLLTYKIFDLIP